MYIYICMYVEANDLDLRQPASLKPTSGNQLVLTPVSGVADIDIKCVYLSYIYECIRVNAHDLRQPAAVDAYLLPPRMSSTDR